MTAFILVITEFTENIWLCLPQAGFKCSALVCWPILPILLHLAHALYMPEGEFFLARFYLGSPTDKYVSFGRAAM